MPAAAETDEALLAAARAGERAAIETLLERYEGRVVGFGLRMRGVPSGEVAERVQRALRLVQLTGQEHKLPGQLSGGQQQRVAIARAIVIEPPLVLMDEPLSNLDAKLRIETRAEIRRIHRELGRATVYVTHDQDEALSLADRIVVMKDGVVQQIAPPSEVYGQPANLHVARFMGYRNVLDAEVVEEAGGRVRIEAPDVKLTGVAKVPLSGRRAAIAIRPEEMTIATSPTAENVIAGRVDNVEYGGRDSLIDVVTRSGKVDQARIPGLDAEVVGRALAEKIGALAIMFWRREEQEHQQRTAGAMSVREALEMHPL
jgi:putative spermidine/putrescine transport system ATP-binding protein